jgi:hypothetical protein
MPTFTARGYPWTRQFFEKDLSHIPKLKPKVFKAFEKHSGLSDRNLRLAFEHGFNPMVRVVNLPGRYGNTPDTSYIELDKTFLTELEAALPRGNVPRNPRRYSPTILEEKLLQLLEATVLHEMVHWARLMFNESARLNVSMGGRRGRAYEGHIADTFEKDAYGMEYTALNLSLRAYLPRTINNTTGP